MWTFDLTWCSSTPQAGLFPAVSLCVCGVWCGVQFVSTKFVFWFTSHHFIVLHFCSFYDKDYITEFLIDQMKCLDVCNVITIQRSGTSWYCLVVEEYLISTFSMINFMLHIVTVYSGKILEVQISQIEKFKVNFWILTYM